MSAVTRLPAHPRTLHAVRRALAERARADGHSDDARRHAFAVAVGQLADGASAGWAIQAGCRALRGQSVPARFHPQPPEVA